jgi:hypothetical protein
MEILSYLRPDYGQIEDGIVGGDIEGDGMDMIEE